MNTVSLKITENYIKIYINDLLHIQLPYVKKIIMQSWKQGKSWYVICFYNKNGTLLNENWYKDKDIWISILKEWDENIN